MPITVIIRQYPVLVDSFLIIYPPVTKRGQHVYQLSLDSEPNVWQCSELLCFFLLPPISVIGCVCDRLDNMQTAGNGACANCKWTWKTPLTTWKENENTGFLIWIKDKGTYLCYLCAQSCPDLPPKNPREFKFRTYEECHNFRAERMDPPQHRAQGITWDDHYRETWQNPWTTNAPAQLTTVSDLNALQTRIGELQKVLGCLQCEAPKI